MTAADVLATCRARGVALTARDDRLRFAAPPGVVDDGLRELLAAHKLELLALVGPCPGCGRPLDAGRCWWCHDRRCTVCRTRSTGSAFLTACLACDLGSPSRN